MEDYRWSILRGRIRNPLAWQLFNALFICSFQLGTIAFFTTPLWRVATAEAPPPAIPFAATFLFAIAFVALETEADRQRYAFHERKAAAFQAIGASDEELAQGLVSSGLFRL